MSTNQDTIDAYDQNAEKWAKRQKEDHSLAHQYLEKPAMYSKLDNLDLTGKSVLCVGCGSGEECEEIRKRGAVRVVGIDISKGLIEQAKYAYPDSEFMVMDMQRLDFPADTFDIIYSSLAFHYAEDWTTILKPAKKILKTEGVILLSTHHPVKWGGQVRKEKDSRTTLLGYTRFEDGRSEIFGDYLNTQKISDTLRDDMKVTYFNKAIGTMIREIVGSGFELVDLVEPKAVDAAKHQSQDFYDVHQKIPLFLILELKKKV